MVRIPSSIYYAVGGLIFCYGVFHIFWASRFQGRERLSHRIRGVLFLVLGVWVFLTGFGWRLGGPKADAPPAATTIHLHRG